jgi:RimJ/RimL family protein N-acetyltransferase
LERAYRGRGLSLAIKVVALIWAKEQGYPYARTYNYSANQRMLASNQRLGYLPQPGFFQVFKQL